MLPSTSDIPMHCPECHSPDVLPIVFGLVMGPVDNAVLGGCIPSPDTHECQACFTRFTQMETP